MNNTVVNILTLVGTLAIGLITSLFLLKGRKFIDIDKKKKTALDMTKMSEEEAEKIKTETRGYVEKRKESFAHECAKREERIKKVERALGSKEEFVKKREKTNKEITLKTVSLKEETQSLQDATKRVDGKMMEQLAKITGKTISELKESVIDRYKGELEAENAERLSRIEEELKESANRTAKKIVINAIQRLCSPTSVETRAITVTVQKDHIKGKIVGKDGQNIKEFERLLGVDVVFNDLPNTISISAFMLVKRRIAQKAMEKLVRLRGGIDKSVIQKTVREAEKETDEELYELGKKGLEKMMIKHDNKEFVRTVGRLQYRTSYGQNIMMHSMEVGWVAAMIGSELGLNTKTCKIGGFLHDLGKAIDQDSSVKDAHDQLSKELMEKYGFSWEETHAAWTHHDAIPQETAEALIVKAADAISASRPGARQESFERYIERMKALQQTAESMEGIKKAYTVSAGREVRVIVDPDIVDDKKIGIMAKELAQKIENNLSYPGKIKVNVIRRTKHTEIAR